MQNLIAKTAGVVVAIALFVGVAVPAANALTSSELVELLISLGIISGENADAARTALGTTTGSSSSSACAAYTRDLTIGATGTDVVNLQEVLIDLGYLNIPVGVSKGYFGSLTQSALAQMQAAEGISPTSGYFGPITRSAFAGLCAASNNSSSNTGSSNTGSSNSSTGLNGGEASLEDFDIDSEMDVEEGEMAHVATVEFDVEDGDVEINRVDVSFVSGSATNEEDEPWDAFDTITLMVDGDEIAEEDIDNENDWLDEDEPFVFRLSGLDYVVEEGDSVEIEIYLTAQNSVDGADTNGNARWDIAIAEDGIRAVDSKGIQNYIGEDDNDLTYAVNGYTGGDFVTFDIEEEGDGEEIKLQSSSDDPDGTTLMVDNDDDSDWYDVFVFDIESEESDIDLETVTIDVTTTGKNYEDIVSDVKLTVDGEEFDVNTTANADGLTATLTFDIDGDVTIDADDTVEAVLSIEFRDTNNQVRYQNGETVQVSVTRVDGEGADDVFGDDAVTGEEHTLIAEGLAEEFVSKNSKATSLGDDTIGVFNFEVELTAFEGTFYIEEDASSFARTLTNGTLISATIVDTNATLNAAGDGYRINEGQTRLFEIEIQVESAATPGTAESVRVTLDSVTYDDTSTLGGTDATLILGAPDYRSGSVTVIDAA